MRFRFCGELDAPDWLLAEISTISSVDTVEDELLHWPGAIAWSVARSNPANCL